MKSLFKSLMLVAVAAMGFTACQKGGDEVVVLDDVKMTINAAVESNRTVIDEANKRVNWSAGDALKVIENSTTYRTTSAINIATDGTAQFTVAFPANTATEFTYNAIYPASALNEDDADKVDATKVKVTVKDAQSATATSFDPLADILVSKHIETTAQPTTLDMQFKRLVALGKLTLTNLPASSTISKVTFTAGEEDVLAGRNYVNAVTGAVSQYGYYNGTNAISVSYDEAVASTTPIYFACNPFDMAEGEVFKVEVICSDATYTREVTIPAGRSLTFVEGDLNTFSVDMASATKEENFVFPDGEYVALALVSNKYYALSCEVSGTRLAAVEVTYNGESTFTPSDENLVWSVAKSAEGYTFKGNNNQYVAWSSGNYAHTQDDAYYLDITKDEEKAGRYNVTSKADATRKLQRNGTATNNYFAFYASNQSGSLFLVPVTVTPKFEVVGLEDSYSYGVEGGTLSFDEFNKLNGLTSTITASTDVDWITIEDLGEEFIITIAENTLTETRTGVITFSAEGAHDVTTTIFQEAVVPETSLTYTFDLTDINPAYDYTSGYFNYEGEYAYWYYTPVGDTVETATFNADTQLALVFLKGSANYAPSYSGYPNSSLSGGNGIAIEGKRISKIEIEFTEAGYMGDLTANEGEYSVSGTTGTWKGASSRVVLTAAASARITAIKVTYDPESEAKFTPEIVSVDPDKLVWETDDAELTKTISVNVMSYLGKVSVGGDYDSSKYAVAVSDDNVVSVTASDIETADTSTLTLSVEGGNSVNIGMIVIGAKSDNVSNVDDVLTSDVTGIKVTSYSNFSNKTVTSSAVYAGQCAGTAKYIQLRSSNSNSGIITTTSGGKARKITVVWDSSTSNGRTLQIYGKSTAYSAATDLYNNSNKGTLLGTIVKGTSTELEIQGDYEYIGMRSASGAMYLNSITVTWEVEQ